MRRSKITLDEDDMEVVLAALHNYREIIEDFLDDTSADDVDAVKDELAHVEELVKRIKTAGGND